MENKPPSILIVDDVPSNIELLGNVLTGEDYDISFANSGHQALETVAFAKPDLILLDISMPGMDGYEVTEILKSKERTRDIPVLFLTALNNTEKIIKGFDVGGVDYITKPFSSKELLARVRTHIELKQKRERIQQQQKRLAYLNTKLTDSIKYAEMIQRSLLPSEEHLQAYFPESFLFSQPRDLLGGDFFFIQQIGDEVILVLADGTGHGVPGAIISTLGITLLDAIVSKNGETSPANIQNQLNKRFTELLNNSSNQNQIGDGLDAAVCSFNIRTQKLKYSGSKRPLLIEKNGEVLRIKGSRFSIGGFHQDPDKEFQEQDIPLTGEEMCYIFSDGFSDQFGGPRNKKYKYKNTRNLIMELAQLPLGQKKERLMSEFREWKHDNEQVDDVIVLGLRPCLVAGSQE